MSSFAIKVKWNREMYDLEANTALAPDIFKGQLYALTGVPPERQKIMYKARQLGDDWEKFVASGLKVNSPSSSLLLQNDIVMTLMAAPTRSRRRPPCSRRPSKR